METVVIKVIVLYCKVPLEARFWTHSNSTNSTGVYGLHFLNVHLTGISGVMTYKVMETITVEPNAPISVKPEGGGGSGNPWEFDCGVYPQGGDFDRTSCI